MKKLLLALGLFLLPSMAMAQCNGVFPNNTACGNVTGSSNTPRAIPLSSFPAATPGGTNGQIQYNNSGAFGGFTASGGATINTSTGVVSLIGSAVVNALNAGCTAIPSVCTSIFGYSNAYWYGATCSGSDDTAGLVAWVAAINANISATIIGKLPSGSCQLNSATSSGLVFTRSSVTIDGQGSIITFTGSTPTNFIFSSVDQSKMVYKNTNFVGNNVASGTGFGVAGAISFTNASVNIQDLLVQGNSFSNFAGNYWIYVETLAPFNNSIQDVKVDRNSFFSQSGNCLGPTNIAINCSFVLVYGVGNSGGTSTPSPNSFVRGVHITNNFMRADYLKTGIEIFGNVQDVFVSGNQVYNAGQLGGQTDDHGSYAIMAYENESPSTTSYSAHAIFQGNYVFNARDICFYMAGQWTDSVYNGNVCNTQTSTATATLPKGGISINGGIGTTVTANRMINIAADGITLVSPAAATDGEWLIADNFASGNLSGAIKLLNSGGTAQTKVSIFNNNLTPTGTAYGLFSEIFSGSSPGSTYTDFKFEGNHINGGAYCYRMFSDSGALTVTNLSIAHNFCAGPTTNGIDVSTIQSGGPVILDDNTVSGAPSGASYVISSTTKLVATGNICANQTVGVCWTTSGAQGTLRNNSFIAVPLANVVATLGSTDLGRSAPTFTYNAGGVVQNLVAAEAGTAGSKYVQREWYFDVAGSGWLQQRQLTGN